MMNITKDQIGMNKQIIKMCLKCATEILEDKDENLSENILEEEIEGIFFIQLELISRTL